MTPDSNNQSPQSAGLLRLLRWTGAAAAAVAIVAPAWMLIGNSAVLAGHPLLPAILCGAIAGGVLWIVRLIMSRERPVRATRLRLVRGSVGRLAVLATVAALAWLNPFTYQPSGFAAPDISVSVDAGSITMAPGGQADVGLIFYPGARVDARAYQEILGPVVDAGYLVVILKEPLGISLLDTGQARGVMDRHPEISTWAVGGHSLGGVSASSFAVANRDVAGVIFYASYPIEAMADSTRLTVLSISGSNDGLSTPDKIDAAKLMLPPSTRYVEVDGGVHAHFGNYGAQPGDGVAGVSRSVSQRQITAATVQFMRELKNTVGPAS